MIRDECQTESLGSARASRVSPGASPRLAVIRKIPVRTCHAKGHLDDHCVSPNQPVYNKIGWKKFRIILVRPLVGMTAAEEDLIDYVECIYSLDRAIQVRGEK